MWFVLLALPSPLKRLSCDYWLMASVSYMCLKQPAAATYQMIRLTLQRRNVEKHFRNLSLKRRRPFWRCFAAEAKPEGRGRPLFLSPAANLCPCASNCQNYWICQVRLFEQRSKQNKTRLVMTGGVHVDLPSRFHHDSPVASVDARSLTITHSTDVTISDYQLSKSSSTKHHNAHICHVSF